MCGLISTVVNISYISYFPDLETRCPKGSKTILYYRAKLEKFAEYLNEDGLVNKLTVFSDTAS